VAETPTKPRLQAGARAVATALGVVVLATCSTGCALFGASALLSAGMAVTQSGVTYVEGKQLRSFELARFEDVDLATERAAEALTLTKINERRRNGHIWKYFRYNSTGKVVVDIYRQSDTVTSIDIEIKSRSSRGMGSLYLRQVFNELAEADAYLEDWGDEARRGARPGGGGDD